MPQHEEDAGTRFREANKRANQSEGAAARQRFAEMLRTGVREREMERVAKAGELGG